MISAIAVCNELIDKSIEENCPLTPLKLQKLLFLIYAYGYKYSKEPVFNAEFSAWQYGPVCETVYYMFSDFGATAITDFASDAKGNRYFPNWKKASNENLKKAFNEVWAKFSDKSSVDLVKLTHRKNGAWSKTKTNCRIDNLAIFCDIREGLYEEARI